MKPDIWFVTQSEQYGYVQDCIQPQVHNTRVKGFFGLIAELSYRKVIFAGSQGVACNSAVQLANANFAGN